MSAETQIDDLLSRWEDRRAQGEEVPTAELCKDCPDLLPEVERRLQVLRQMQKLAATTGEAVTVPSPAVADGQTACLPPSGPRGGPAAPSMPTVAGYDILDELGRGGMGVVYKARQTKLGRMVALKMILAGGHAGRAEVERFRAEAEAIARLQHPNIVQIHEVGEQNGLPYFSLEFCAGGSLEKKLSGTPLPPRDAAALVEKLARAMQVAHEKGVLHRDLKPANVLLAEDGTPKITDFGLAKKLDEAGKTATGAVMGTPSYMAPEQAGGKSKDTGPPCDIYALGAMLYDCLTGRPPFKAATTLDTVMQVLSEEPVPPTQLNAKVPRDLETICLKCLRKEPARRYRTAADLAQELYRFQAGEPIQARPVGRVERLSKWVKRHPARAGLLAAVVLGILGVGLALALGMAGSLYFAIAADAEAEKTRKANAKLAQSEKETKNANTSLEIANTGLKQANAETTAANQKLAASEQQARKLAADEKKARQDAEASATRQKVAQEMTYWLLYDSVNDRLRRGATPQDNANVLLWQAYGPNPGVKMPPEYFEWLGIDRPPEGAQYFVNLEQYVKLHGQVAPDAYERLDQAAQHPWTAREQPLLDQWLMVNEKPLSLVREATKRRLYFSPAVPPRSDQKELGLMGALVPTFACRGIAKALIARAMKSVAERQAAQAWQDLLACHRLGRLVAQGGTLIDGLAGIAIEGIAAKADLEFLQSGGLGGPELNACRRDLDQLPPLPPFADCMEHLERLMFVGVVISVQRGGFGALEQLTGAMSKPAPADESKRVLRPIANVDWNTTLRVGNRWYDRVAATMRRADTASRDAELARIDAELKAIRGRMAKAVGIADLMNAAGEDAAARGKQIAELLVLLLMPAAAKISQAGDRHEQGQRNLRVAFALAAYQRDHGRYPETLAALAPGYLQEVPHDLFSGKALIYRPGEAGYLLYSVGPNGRDDLGHSSEDNPPGDDLSVRMPPGKAKSK